MAKTNIDYLRNILLATIIATIGYLLLRSTTRTGLVDMCIEAGLFLTGSIFAFKGFINSKKIKNKYFKRFELFYTITYSIVSISFLMGIWYYLKNPNVLEIGIANVASDNWLITMSSIKSLSMIFLILTWYHFYKYLSIKATSKTKLVTFLIGTTVYLLLSVIIWKLTNDISVLSLGVIVGSIIGIFSLIALDKRTRYLTFIFVTYNLIHLVEFYMMGLGKDLTTGINNPVYWGVTVLYVLEVRRWIKVELNTNK